MAKRAQRDLAEPDRRGPRGGVWPPERLTVRLSLARRSRKAPGPSRGVPTASTPGGGRSGRMVRFLMTIARRLEGVTAHTAGACIGSVTRIRFGARHTGQHVPTRYPQRDRPRGLRRRARADDMTAAR